MDIAMAELEIEVALPRRLDDTVDLPRVDQQAGGALGAVVR